MVDVVDLGDPVPGDGEQLLDILSSGVDDAVQRLDLTSLESIHTAAAALRGAHTQIDLLIHNAGVMQPRGRRPGTVPNGSSAPTTWATSP